MEGLSDREKQIVNLVLDGWLYVNIAAKLDITRATVATHMQRVYRKLGVTNQMELARKVLIG
jgi:DNA-binding NarL/FixJ family response regulator